MTNKELSSLLQYELARRNWSVSDLARAAEMNRETVRRAVHGIGFASLENANSLLAILGHDLTADVAEEEATA